MEAINTMLQSFFGECISPNDNHDPEKVQEKGFDFNPSARVIPPPPDVPPPPPPPMHDLRQSEPTPSKKKGKKSAQKHYQQRQKKKEAEMQEKIMHAVQNELNETRKNRAAIHQQRMQVVQEKRQLKNLKTETDMKRVELQRKERQVRQQELDVQHQALQAEKKESQAEAKLNLVKINEEIVNGKQKSILDQEKKFKEQIAETIKDIQEGKTVPGKPVEIKFANDDENIEEHQCCVCYDDMRKTQVGVFHCRDDVGHKACYSCAMELFSRGHSCPKCRAPQTQPPLRLC